MILYSVIVSFWLSFYHHGRVVVPGHEVAGLGAVRGVVSRSWILGLVMTLGLFAGIPGRGYAQWWEASTSNQSMVLWAVMTVPLTVALWVLKEITFQVMAKPSVYAWFGHQPPSVHKTSMVIPTVWNVVFWVWLPFTPTLPFYKSFIRVFWVAPSPIDTVLAQ
jgi:hypothetical protein